MLARKGRIHRPHGIESNDGQTLPRLGNGPSAVFGSGHDSPSGSSASDLELGLHEDQTNPGGEACDRRGQITDGDERNIDYYKSKPTFEVVGLELANVGAFVEIDPGVLAQGGLQLIGTDIHRDHSGRAALEKTVGEASGRRAYVETDHASDVDPKRLESGRQLETPTPDKTGTGNYLKGHVGANPEGGFSRHSAVDRDPALGN